MVDETATLLDRWSRHPEHGVNALAANLPRFKMSLAGVILADEWPAPTPVDLYLNLEDDGTAEELDPPTTPAFLTWGEGQPTEIDLKDTRRDIHGFAIIIGTAFVTAGDVDAAKAAREAGAYLRANRISFKRFNNQTLSSGYRELDDIRIVQLRHVASQKVPGLPVGNSKLWGFNVTQALVVDRLT